MLSPAILIIYVVYLYDYNYAVLMPKIAKPETKRLVSLIILSLYKKYDNLFSTLYKQMHTKVIIFDSFIVSLYAL